MKLVVLRMGHRPMRDKRVTTHIALVARAFGADGMIISDINDISIKNKIIEVNERFGGNFSVEMGIKWRSAINNWQKSGGDIIHLTVYGMPLPKVIEEIRNSPNDKLIVIGASKIPRPVYDLATYNVSITNQPHSEIAALAIFLDHYFQGIQFDRKFENARFEIIPDAKEKIVKEKKEKD